MVCVASDGGIDPGMEKSLQIVCWKFNIWVRTLSPSNRFLYSASDNGIEGKKRNKMQTEENTAKYREALKKRKKERKKETQTFTNRLL